MTAMLAQHRLGLNSVFLKHSSGIWSWEIKYTKNVNQSIRRKESSDIRKDVMLVLESSKTVKQSDNLKDR